jgi:branched-chain amino acid transport system permease protein
MDFEYFFELFLGGLTRGSIYALIALGYTMVYGIVQLINFAHGEIYMIGAFTALIVISVLTMMGWNRLAILVIASIVAVSILAPTAGPWRKSPTSHCARLHGCRH